MRTQLIVVQSNPVLGEIAGPASSSLSSSLAFSSQVKRRYFWWVWNIPFKPNSLPSGVHMLFINQELLKRETTMSHQYVISWVTASITLHSQLSPLLCFLFSFTMTLSFIFLSLHFILKSKLFQAQCGLKTKAGITIRSSFLPGIRVREKERGHKLSGYEKCFQRQPFQECRW